MNSQSKIIKYPIQEEGHEVQDRTFSVLIPTWNNLPFLKNCIHSLRQNSSTNLQIIVIVNEGIDGTVEWLKNEGNIDFIHAQQNIGICYALNACRSLIQTDYVVYLNDDMYVLPDWDKYIYDEIIQLDTKYFMLSGTMIEPHNTGNPCVIIRDFGQTLASFDEKALLEQQSQMIKNDWSGSTWPPNVVHIDLWDMVGGLSIEYSPGMYSDPDFTRKLYHAGVRIFKGVGKSLVYHFGSVSTGRVKKNTGRKTYLNKWGHTANDFAKAIQLGNPYQGKVEIDTNKLSNKLINKLKKIR